MTVGSGWVQLPGYRRRRRGTPSGVLGRERAGELAWRRLDWTLLAAVLMLSSLGAVLVFSATRERLLVAGEDPGAFFKRHLINLAIGLLLASLVAWSNARFLRTYTPLLYLASLLGLVAVLVIGKEVNGAKAWIILPAGFSLQPSEFAKVGLIVVMAMVLSRRHDGSRGPRSRDVLLALGLAAIPIVLVLLQNDLGTIMVFAVVVFGLIAMSGARTGWVVGLLVAAVLAGGFLVGTGRLDDYQVRRLTSFVNPSADPRGAGYNTQQARIAIGSGGARGSGLFEGPQTQGRFVPEQHTDFIYTVAGEELGLAGAGGILLLLALILWRALRIGMGSDDIFGRLVAAGIVCWFAFQSFQNIGMCLGIMPVTGLPLPFVSYGGSSMFANLLAVGLLQNIHLHRRG